GVVDGHASGVLSRLLDETEARRLSRVCQMTVAAGRLALAEAGLAGGTELALLVGTEFGDMVSTIRFVDDYLQRGIPGLSALLFPHTVMNTMAAPTASAALRARGRSPRPSRAPAPHPPRSGSSTRRRTATARAKRGSVRCSTRRWPPTGPRSDR